MADFLDVTGLLLLMLLLVGLGALLSWGWTKWRGEGEDEA